MPRYTDRHIVAFVQRLRDARLAEQTGDLEPMRAIFEEGPEIAWAACTRGLITFQMECTDAGLAVAGDDKALQGGQ